MLVLRTSNFQGATIKPIVPRQTLYCLNYSPLNFPLAACLKTENDTEEAIYQNFQPLYGALRCFVFYVVSSHMMLHLYVYIQFYL